MSGTKLSSLAGASPLSLSDLFYAVQTPGVGGTKATLAQLETLFSASFLALSGGTLTGSLTLGGNISAAAWTTAGIKLKGGGSTLTDTTSSGTVALAVTNKLGGNTIAASSATTYTDYGTLYLDVPAAGTNVTITNPWSLIASGAMKSTALTLTGGTLTLNGATSGASVLSAPAVAGSATITLPGVTSTLATLGANTFTSLQTITIGAANTGVLASTGYSLTGSDATSMVNLAGTWNTSGTPTAIKINVTDTASNASSLLMDLQVGGTSKFKVRKDGLLIIGDVTNGGAYGFPSPGVFQAFGTDSQTAFNSTIYGTQVRSGGYYAWSSSSGSASSAGDLTLYRDAAGVLAQRNSTNAQEFKLYASYTDASNWEAIRYVSYGTQRDGGSGPRIVYSAAGTGTNARNFELDVGNAAIQFSLNGARRLMWDYQKQYPETTASYDFGSTSKRFRSLYLGESLTGSATTGAIDIATTWNTSGTPNLINIALTDTASNAASNIIKATVGATTVFAVDKAGKPTFGTYTTLGAETLAGYITITDAAGNARKIAVIA